MVDAHGVGEYLCVHHSLLSHAAAYHLYKEKYFEKQQGEIGLSGNFMFYYPKDKSVPIEFVEFWRDIAVSILVNFFYRQTYKT
jgi:beta-glucosidase/6-phospho-beta-glucosidase/beta-galactosidase